MQNRQMPTMFGWVFGKKTQNFYKKNGFVEFDQHIFQLGDDKQTDIMMKLQLKTSENKKGEKLQSRLSLLEFRSRHLKFSDSYLLRYQIDALRTLANVTHAR